MSDMYGLFNYNVEQDETRALFGVYKTHADSFWYAANNGMIGNAMCFRVQPWEYEVMMMEANYNPTILAVTPSPDTKEEKEEEKTSENESLQKQPPVTNENADNAMALSVLNRPQTMFLTQPSAPVEQANQKRYVCVYAIHAQSPLLVDVPVHVSPYDRAAHDEVVGVVNRILLANALTSKKKPVVDVLDYFEKVSLLRLSENKFQTISVIYPVFGESPKKKKNKEESEALEAPYGAPDKTAGQGLDAFSKKVKRTFADVKRYFDEKFEDDNVRNGTLAQKTRKRDKLHKAVKVKCTRDSVGSKYCGTKASSALKKSKTTLKSVRLANTSETTPFKATYGKGLREAMRPGLCALVASFVAKIDGRLSVTTLNLKKTPVKLRLDEVSDKKFIQSLDRPEIEPLGTGTLLVTTTFDKVLKFYTDKTKIAYPTSTKRLVKMALLQGIDMFTKLKDVSLRDTNNPESKIKFSALLYGAFETIVFKKIRSLVQSWIIDSLKNHERIDDPAKMVVEKERMRTFLAEMRLLRSRVKPAFLSIKQGSQLTKETLNVMGASFKRYEGAVKAFLNYVKKIKKEKVVNPRYDMQLKNLLVESLDFVKLLDNLSPESISKEANDKRLALVRGILQTESGAKALFGAKICVDLDGEGEILDALRVKFDAHITAAIISSLFESFASSEPLDADPRIVSYVSKMGSKNKARVDSPPPAAARLGDSSEWLDDDEEYEEEEYKEDEMMALLAEKLENNNKNKDVAKPMRSPTESATNEANWFENEVLF